MKKFKYQKISNTKKLRYIDNYYKKNLYIVFLPGFMSDVEGQKPQTFKRYAIKKKLGFLALEYFGHGKSSGEFTKCNISIWSKNTRLLIKKVIRRNNLYMKMDKETIWHFNCAFCKGYWTIASMDNWFKKNNINTLDVWSKDSEYEIYHFIGKDIAYFHGLFWPALLSSANLKLPDGIFVHGFLTINGEKMSKSKGTGILAKDFEKMSNPELLRYYFAAKLNDKVEDIDLNFEDYVQRINSDLVGKYLNIASRSASFIKRNNNQIS